LEAGKYFVKNHCKLIIDSLKEISIK